MKGGFNFIKVSVSRISGLDNAGEDDNLILRVSINSHVFIEDAAPLTKEGIVAICKEC